MDAITTTRMLQMAQVMQQLPADGGHVPLRQLEMAREAFQSLDSIPAPSAEPMLVSEPQHVDVRA